MPKWCEGLISCGLQVFVTISLIAYQLLHVRRDEKELHFTKTKESTDLQQPIHWDVSKLHAGFVVVVFVVAPTGI